MLDNFQGTSEKLLQLKNNNNNEGLVRVKSLKIRNFTTEKVEGGPVFCYFMRMMYIFLLRKESELS